MRGVKKIRRFYMLYALLMVICTIFFTDKANADIGPKPSITVYVKNFKSQDYYLDLLVKEGDGYVKYNMFNSTVYALQYKDLKLYKYREDGWIADHIRNPLLYGSLTGSYDGDKKMMIHSFSYFGIPDRFKIIIQYESGEIVVSNAISPKQFNSEVILDLSTGKAYTIPRLIQGYVYFFFLIAATIIIESIIALFFRIKPIRIVILVNLLTQVLLQTSILTAFYCISYASVPYIFYGLEILIPFIEYLFYKKFAKFVNYKKLMVYVFFSNLITFLIGLAYA